MARAWDEVAGKGCLGRCDPGEPVFVLRGQDVLAPHIVRLWAQAAAAAGAPDSKVAEALDLADTMAEWPVRKVPD